MAFRNQSASTSLKSLHRHAFERSTLTLAALRKTHQRLSVLTMAVQLLIITLRTVREQVMGMSSEEPLQKGKGAGVEREESSARWSRGSSSVFGWGA